MTITINVQSGDGVNINQGGSSYLATLPGMFDSSKNLGYFKDSLEDSPQYGVAQTVEDSTGAYTGGATLIAGGSLSYSLQTHVVDGKLNSLALGEGLDGVEQGMYLTTKTMSVREAVVTFSKLALDSDKGDNVSDILYGMMTGDGAEFVKLLAKSSVKFNGGAGDDTYIGGSKADALSGSGGSDTLAGGKGNDKLAGGIGADALTGGAGKDQFIFKSVADSGPGDFDTIADFSGGKGDRLNLKGIDADTTSAGNQSFTFIGESDFSGKAGELRVEKAGSTVDISADVDGDGDADFAIHLSTAASLSESHFLL
jgi:Ca2+-binding RTX toxin-like protein